MAAPPPFGFVGIPGTIPLAGMRPPLIQGNPLMMPRRYNIYENSDDFLIVNISNSTQPPVVAQPPTAMVCIVHVYALLPYRV